MKNGTILVLCTWVIIAAEHLEGPWRTVLHLDISPSTRMGVSGSWEGERALLVISMLLLDILASSQVQVFTH